MSNRSMSGIVLELELSGTLQNTLNDTKVASVRHPSLSYRATILDGCEVSQANRGWQSESRALTTGASETLDLYDLGAVDIGGGVGCDGLGQSIVFEEIVAIAIVNNNAVGVAGQLEIIPAVANGWTPIGSHTAATGGALRGGGILLKANPAEEGFNVTDAANHQITITANGAAISYSIYLLARSDDEASSSSSISSNSSSFSSSSSVSSQSSSSSLSSSSSPSSLSSLSSMSPSSASTESSSSPSSSSWTT